MKNEKFYKGFNTNSLERLPVSFQKLTEINSSTPIKTSGNENYSGFKVRVYNTKLINCDKNYAPISKIIDFG